MTAALTTRTAKTADATPVSFQAAFADLLGDGSKLAVAHALLNTLGALIDPASKQDVAGVVTALGAPAQTADITAATAKMEAVRALLAAPLTIAPQRVESLWTDDTGAYFVRVDLGGTISWADLSGNAASAPATGARPAGGATVLLSRSSFQATAGATGYSIGDYLDHFVTTDPASGAVLGNFWVNLSTGLKLTAAPASGNISPAAPLPSGAATDAKSEAIRALLAGTLTVKPSACTTTQTVVSGTGGVLIAANPNRKSLRWMNIGAAAVTVAPGAAAPTVGQGMIYEPNGSGAGHQGGSEVINDPAVATNAFAYAASSTVTIIVWEGQ